MSLIVYCVHPMFCKFVNSAAPNTIVSYIIVSLLSILVGVFWKNYAKFIIIICYEKNSRNDSCTSGIDKVQK